MLYTILQILLTWLSITFILFLFRRRRLPPGPFPLPVIGNLLSLGKKPHISLAKLAKEHGPVMTLQLGTRTTVVISSSEAAKLVLQTHDSVFSHRAIIDAHTATGHSEASVALLPPNDKWKVLRKICATQIFSNSRLEASRKIRLHNMQRFLDYVKDCCANEEEVNIGEVSFTTMLNSLTNILFSIDMAEYRSEISSELKQLVRNVMEDSGSPNIADFYPFLKVVDPQGVRIRMTEIWNRMYQMFDEITEARIKARGEKVRGAEEKDVLDALINMAHEEGTGLNLDDIRHLFLDLFIAGTDTMSSTIEWAMSELLNSPSKLHKAQAEVRSVINPCTTVEESDIARLPYLQAVIKETLRLHPPVPFLIPRKLPAVNAELTGYTIPKGAHVFVNVWAMGRDESVWGGNATEFEPERFLLSKLDYKGRDFEYLPFGAGRRICPGLSLAHWMVPLVVGSLLHDFDWKVPEGLDMEEKFGFNLQKAKPLVVIPMTII